MLQTGFFPPVLLLSGSLQHTVNPFNIKEGKGFTTVFKKQAQAAEDSSFSTQFWAAHGISGSTPGEQNPSLADFLRPAASPHLQLKWSPPAQIPAPVLSPLSAGHVKEQLVSQAAKAAARKAE